ncbi:hypothetical protein M885DRAFT_567544 [Pelagophyceae sp. CCMP2097]|nr:hypothetical protein M885DRAFT_567544 [Pelagophyceae sp. CCMP2097]
MAAPSWAAAAACFAGSHAAYLVHYASTYNDGYAACLRGYRIRTDYATVHPLLLEWTHTAEMALVSVASQVAAGHGLKGGAAVLFVCALLASALACDRRLVLATRQWRLAGLFSAFFAAESTRLKCDAVGLAARAAAVAHALVVPSALRTVSKTAAAALFIAHVVVVFNAPYWPTLAFVGLSREWLLSREAGDIKGPLRGLGAEIPTLPGDLAPHTCCTARAPARAISPEDEEGLL